MDPITVTMLSELDINKDDYMIKVRIIRLWKQLRFNTVDEIHSIQMILMDEQGGKIHCSLESPHTIRWGKFFQEYGTVYINKPTLGISDGNRKLVNHQYKVFFIYDTTVSECTSFTGSLHGFSFAPYQSLLDNKIPDNTTFDLIGVGDIVRIIKVDFSSEQPEKKAKKIVFQSKDEAGLKVFVILWDDYANQLFQYYKNNPEQTQVVFILQFARIKFYNHNPYVNNTFSASKLFVNDQTDEIVSFKKNLLPNNAADISSKKRNISSSIFYSLHDEFLTDCAFYKINDIHGLYQGKLAVILGTIITVFKDGPWHYPACTRCNKKVEIVMLPNDENGANPLQQRQVYYCPREDCKGKIIYAVPSFMVRIRVQGLQGVVTFTLFEKDVKRILNTSAKDLLQKYQDADAMHAFPVELDALLERQYAFKIVVTKVNPATNVRYFNILKFTDDAAIISQLQILEKKASLEHPLESDSQNVVASDFPSQDTVPSKDATSYTGDSSTPISKVVHGSCPATPLGHSNSTHISSPLTTSKRKLVDVYDVDDPVYESATKFKTATVGAASVKLLIPKLEK